MRLADTPDFTSGADFRGMMVAFGKPVTCPSFAHGITRGLLTSLQPLVNRNILVLCSRGDEDVLDESAF
jgi:hypothetical protein